MDKIYLERIEEAEKKADEIMNKASTEAEQLYEETRKKLKSDQEAFEEKLEKLSNEIIREEIEKANTEARKVIAKNLADCEDIRKSCHDKVDDAVLFVVNKIGVSKWQ